MYIVRRWRASTSVELLFGDNARRARRFFRSPLTLYAPLLVCITDQGVYRGGRRISLLLTRLGKEMNLNKKNFFTSE